MELIDKDRLFPRDARGLELARALYAEVAALPIISPHGHTDPSWFAKNEPFTDPARLIVTPDHYVFRMLHSQGIPLEKLGIARLGSDALEFNPRDVWRVLAENYYLFRGTPSAMWLDHTFQEVFGVTTPLGPKSADAIYDQIGSALRSPEFLPRSLFERFKIEVLATTDSAIDSLDHHRALASSDWPGRVIPTYRPDAVVDPEALGFRENVEKLGAITGENIASWSGYLAAHRARRQEFISLGATASDHGHPSPRTEDLDECDAEDLYRRALEGDLSEAEADAFRGQMLTEMARMSLDDGLVLQLHPGSYRNHSDRAFAAFGPDKGFDIPKRADFVNGLRPLLNAVGSEPDLSIIVFTLDESTYGRELAPLAGVYPALKLGPAWWFFDSADGMRRYREMTTETAGFYNTVGFNDDTRAFCSIPARHDVARRVDCAFLSGLVTSGRLRENDAFEVAYDLSYRLPKKAYRL